MVILVEIEVFMLVMDLLNHFDSYLSSWLLLVVSVWSPGEYSLLFLHVLAKWFSIVA
jgi:hypothetical protein